MQSGTVQVQEFGGHAVEDQKQMRTSNMWINHRGSVQMKFYNYSWLIYMVYHLLVKNNKIEGREGGGGLKERGSY